MEKGIKEKIKNQGFLDKIISTEEAVSLIKNNMKIAVSGFALFGEPKLFLKKLAERDKIYPFKIDLYTGASIGPDGNGALFEANLINKRVPYQANPISRREINNQNVLLHR